MAFHPFCPLSIIIRPTPTHWNHVFELKVKKTGSHNKKEKKTKSVCLFMNLFVMWIGWLETICMSCQNNFSYYPYMYSIPPIYIVACYLVEIKGREKNRKNIIINWYKKGPRKKEEFGMLAQFFFCLSSQYETCVVLFGVELNHLSHH